MKKFDISRGVLQRTVFFRRGGPQTRAGGLAGPLYVGYQGKKSSQSCNDAGRSATYRAGLGRTAHYRTEPVREFHGVKWIFEAGSDRLFAGAPVVPDDTVYVGDKQGNFYAINRQDDTEKWKSTADDMPGPAAVTDGLLYFGGGSIFYALEARTGNERWRFRAEGTTCYSPAVAGGVVLGGRCSV